VYLLNHLNTTGLQLTNPLQDRCNPTDYQLTINLNLIKNRVNLIENGKDEDDKTQCNWDVKDKGNDDVHD
jgi:hypothetical protein